MTTLLKSGEIIVHRSRWVLARPYRCQFNNTACETRIDLTRPPRADRSRAVHAELQDGGNLISTRDRLSLSEVREDETSGRDTLRSFCRPYVRNVELQLRIPRVASHRRDLSAPSARDAESAGRGGVFFFFLFFFSPWNGNARSAID